MVGGVLGCVAGNLIAAFVTGADGNFDAVVKSFSSPIECDRVFISLNTFSHLYTFILESFDV